MQRQLAVFQTDRADPVALFRQHFILFHSLYLLRADLLTRQLARLEIGPLRIALLPYQATTSGQLTEADPLQHYYLDLSHLQETGPEDVQALLDDFWRQLARTEQRAEALAVLGLSDPVDDAKIRRRYREQVMQHHPDRGGNTARLQLLNAAIAALLPDRR